MRAKASSREGDGVHLLHGAGDLLGLVGLGLGLGGVRGSVAQGLPRFLRLLVGFHDGLVDGRNPLERLLGSRLVIVHSPVEVWNESEEEGI